MSLLIVYHPSDILYAGFLADRTNGRRAIGTLLRPSVVVVVCRL